MLSFGKSTLMQSCWVPASGEVEVRGVVAQRGFYLANVGQERGAIDCAESWGCVRVFSAAVWS